MVCKATQLMDLGDTNVDESISCCSFNLYHFLLDKTRKNEPQNGSTNCAIK